MMAAIVWVCGKPAAYFQEMDMQKSKSMMLVAVLALSSAGVAYAVADKGKENDGVADFAKAKVSIGQAISAAEQAAAGKATRAELENERHGLVYEVEVVNPDKNTVFDVRVDAVSGKVLASVADQADGKEDDKDD
jgi:uncharacterized membrane protein YkoI